MSDVVNNLNPECDPDALYLDELLGLDGFYCPEESEDQTKPEPKARVKHGERFLKEDKISGCTSCHEASPIGEYKTQYESLEAQEIYSHTQTTDRYEETAPNCFTCHDVPLDALDAKPKIVIDTPISRAPNSIIKSYIQSASTYRSNYRAIGGRGTQSISTGLEINPNTTQNNFIFSTRVTGYSESYLNTNYFESNDITNPLDADDNKDRSVVNLYEATANFRTTGALAVYANTGLTPLLTPFGLTPILGGEAGIRTDDISIYSYAGVLPYQTDTTLYGGGAQVKSYKDGNSATAGIGYQNYSNSNSIGDFVVEGATTYALTKKGFLTTRAGTKVYAEFDNPYFPISRADTMASLRVGNLGSVTVTDFIENKQTDDPFSILPQGKNHTVRGKIAVKPLKFVEAAYSAGKGTYLVYDNRVDVILDFGKIDVSGYYQDSQYSLTTDGIGVTTYGGALDLDLAGTSTTVALGRYSQNGKLLLDDDKSNITRLMLNGNYTIQTGQFAINVQPMLITDVNGNEKRAFLKLTMPFGKKSGSADQKYRTARRFFENEIGKLDKGIGALFNPNVYVPYKIPKDITFSHIKHSENDITCEFCHDYEEETNSITLPDQGLCYNECHQHDDKESPSYISINYDPAQITIPRSPTLKPLHGQHIKKDIECLSCHTEFESRDIEIAKVSDRPRKTTCFTCHDPDANLGRSVNDFLTTKYNTKNDCGVCHEDKIKDVAPMATTGPMASLYHGDLVENSWKQGFHNLYRDEQYTSCNTCHDNSVCNDCHAPAEGGGSILTKHDMFVDLRHGLDWMVGDRSCVSCHTPEITNPVDLCTSGCHTESLVAFVGKHPAGMRCDLNETNPSNLHAGYASSLGARICMTCHSDDSHSKTAAANPALSCNTCHNVDLGECE